MWGSLGVPKVIGAPEGVLGLPEGVLGLPEGVLGLPEWDPGGLRGSWGSLRGFWGLPERDPSGPEGKGYEGLGSLGPFSLEGG